MGFINRLIYFPVLALAEVRWWGWVPGKVTGGCRGDGEREQQGPVLALAAEAPAQANHLSLSLHTSLRITKSACPPAHTPLLPSE